MLGELYLYVYPTARRNGCWSIKKSSSGRASFIINGKTMAVKKATEMALKLKCIIYIIDESGNIEHRITDGLMVDIDVDR